MTTPKGKKQDWVECSNPEVAQSSKVKNGLLDNIMTQK